VGPALESQLGSQERRGLCRMSKIEELADRVERLLLRHDELLRTKTLLEQSLLAATQERDSLRSRLNAARGRIDALLDRLPTDAVPAQAAEPPEPAEPAEPAAKAAGSHAEGHA